MTGHEVSGARGRDMAGKARRPILVVHVIAAVWVGGAETALLRLIENSDRTVLKHALISLSAHRDLMVDAFVAAGAEVIFLDISPSRLSPLEVGRYLRALRRLRPDVIQ